VLRGSDGDRSQREAEEDEEDTERAPLRQASHPRSVVVGSGVLIPESCPRMREYNPGREGV
jgi:hypothetical protein